MIKRFACTLMSCWLLTGFSYAQKAPTRLIIRGDDMGFSHSGNLALIKAYKDGIEKSIEVLVPAPWFPEAVHLLAENPGIDVGVHLAITSEWDLIKWRPLSDCPSLRDADGYFYPMLRPNKNYSQMAVSQNNWKLEDIEKEFRAQIELALKKIPRISHVSGHMGCTNLSADVRSLVKRLAKEYQIDIDLDERQVAQVTYIGAHNSLAEKIESFSAMINQLAPGKTYMFLDHPGFDNEELQAIHHIGYENVAEDRQGVTDLFTNKEIMALLKNKNIELISYSDLQH